MHRSGTAGDDDAHGHRHRGRRGGGVWGLFMIVAGTWWLLGELAVVPFEWSWVGPLALIAVGVSALLGRGCWGCGWGAGHPPERHGRRDDDDDPAARRDA